MSHIRFFGTANTRHGKPFVKQNVWAGKRLAKMQHEEEFQSFDSQINITYDNQKLQIKLFGEIPSPGSDYVHKIVEQLETPGLSEIYVLINSYGGSYDTAVMLYNMLKQLSNIAVVTTYATGFVFSAATIIYMAGTHRVAQPYTNFMIHTTRIDAGYDSSPNTYNFVASHISTVNRLMRDIFKEHFTEPELETILQHGQDLYFDEIEAFERGIAQHIGLILPDSYAFIPIAGPLAQLTDKEAD